MPTENNLQPGLVSIMMPAYNAAEFIQSAIESVLAQTYPQWELIVVNDGSSDDTAQILKRFSDSRIRVIEQANAGEAAARNRALDAARGEFLAFLDADDQFLPEFLALALAFLSEHPQCDAVYSDGYYIDRQDAVIGRLSDQRRGPFEGDLLEALIRASDVFGPPICTLLKRQVWLDHPLRFDPQIVIGPDWDFFTRMAQYQHYGYLNQPTCRYRVHQTNITVRTGSQKRRESLAICRSKAVQLPRFSACSLETRSYVFYDLLVNLLSGEIDRQQEVVGWSAFRALPKTEQARLFRLMALNGLGVSDAYIGYAHYLINQAAALAPQDQKNRWLARFFHLNPALTITLLKLRNRLRRPAASTSPFSIPV